MRPGQLFVWQEKSQIIQGTALLNWDFLIILNNLGREKENN